MTMLQAIEARAKGGDTQFANTRLGYATLAPEMKSRIADMTVEHSWDASRRNTDSTPATEEQKRQRPPVTHPLVRAHPDTSDKTLYLGMHLSHIHDMPRTASDALLAELQDHTTRPQLVYTHQWRTGDCVMWDNRCLLHRARPNYDAATERRVLHRTVVIGTAPN